MMNLITKSNIDLDLHADKVNSQFTKSQSHYVTLTQRLRSVTEGETYLQSTLENAIDDFRDRNPQYKKWSDITLCSAQKTTLDKIAIDTTLQRLLIFFWAMDILDEFWEIQVEPIRVYQDSACPGKYVCWDGQHTAIVLFIIASMVLGEDISKCEVPIVVYPSTQKAEMRRVFMAANGEGKRKLDAIDKFQQMIFGVRTDGSQIESWVIAEQKQQWLESAKMFATHKKFNDVNEPGAYTRMDEIMDTKNYQPIITRYFTQYFTAVCRSSRPVQPKESVFMYEFFKICETDSNFEVTDKYIRDVAKALKVTGHGDFDAITFWHKAKTSYQNYYRDNMRNGWDILGIQYPEARLAITFMIAQLKKAGLEVPHYTDTYWEVDEGDLF